MEKIKFIIDSSSDITRESANEYDIEIVPMGINVEGRPYLEGIDFTNEEFYKILLHSEELPSTSAINPATWYEVFNKYYGKYDRLVVATVGKALSSSYESALLAKSSIYANYPNAREKFKIDIYDSGSASAGYSYPMVQAAEKLRCGISYDEIREYFEDWFNSFEVYFVAFSFDIVKKSGRVNAPTAYIGELLNIRPIMSCIDGVFKPFSKTRGDASVPPKLLEIAKTRMRKNSEYLLLNGIQPLVGEKLCELFEKEFGYKVSNIYQPGPAMVINAGPRMLCVGFLGKRRR